MLKNFLKNLFLQNKTTPRELRKKYGALTNSDESIHALVNGLERQWKRYNDPIFQKQEFYKRFNKIFKKNSKSEK